MTMVNTQATAAASQVNVQTPPTKATAAIPVNQRDFIGDQTGVPSEGLVT